MINFRLIFLSIYFGEGKDGGCLIEKYHAYELHGGRDVFHCMTTIMFEYISPPYVRYVKIFMSIKVAESDFFVICIIKFVSCNCIHQLRTNILVDFFQIISRIYYKIPNKAFVIFVCCLAWERDAAPREERDRQAHRLRALQEDPARGGGKQTSLSF